MVASLVIRGLEEEVKEALRRQAAEHGRSMEAEARTILSAAVVPQRPERGLASAIHETVVGFGIDEPLEIPERTGEARAADFSDNP